jgi:hypothetical protein
MVNRILNAPLSPENRSIWLGALADASQHQLANQETRDSALNFLDYQRQHPEGADLISRNRNVTSVCRSLGTFRF